MDRKQAVESREMWVLSPSEKARLTAALTIGGVKVARGKGPGRHSAAAERVWTEAARRVDAEDRAAEAEANRRAAAKAERKAARKGWW